MEKVISKILHDVGIGGIDDLKAMGSLAAIKIVCRKQTTACVNMLYALESVIRGIDMDELPEKEKRALKRRYEKMLKDAPSPKKAPPRETRDRC